MREKQEQHFARQKKKQEERAKREAALAKEKAKSEMQKMLEKKQSQPLSEGQDALPVGELAPEVQEEEEDALGEIFGEVDTSFVAATLNAWSHCPGIVKKQLDK